MAKAPATCKFVSQFDGTSRCQDAVEDLGLCAFHRDALDRGEIDVDGVLSDSCSDQERRRAVNYHGMTNLPPLPD